MERRAVRLSEAQYSARKEEVFTNLDDQQKAVFQLVESFSLLENQNKNPVHTIRWRKRMNSNEVIDATMRGHLALLPAPGYYLRHPGYERFNWKVFQERHGRVLAFYGIQMRLQERFITLDEVAGESSFATVENEIKEILSNNTFPFIVKDTTGFSYVNPAFERLKTEKAA